ncbi:hypothetical protein L1049_015470 [Liquidambar formosana]|uniref:Phytosulfokine n=1 Tax=Liquidambar formosana TaxID=63359 RepID=A0AAP0RXX5_LIQFO
MSSKVSTLCMVTLVLLFALTHAGRPEPAFSNVAPVKTQHGDVEGAKNVEVEENCEGPGEEECLMRRTLAAHLDYIYTQKQKP